jgi:lipoprotein-releasing system permease protein
MFSIWFARRITFKSHRSVSRLVVGLAVCSIMLGVAVMEISISIVGGFEHEIHKKVVGFGSHLQIGPMLAEVESTVEPVPRAAPWLDEIRRMPEVKHMNPYVVKPAMIKSDITQEGIILKGVDSTFRWDFFRNALDTGAVPVYGKGEESKEILISKKLAALLDVKVGDRCFMYFFEDDVKVRKVKISGIYETGLEEFDLVQVICDLTMLQRLQGWEYNDVSGFEITLDDLDQDQAVESKINEMIPYEYEANSIRRVYPEIFEWVALQHQNVWFILGLMILIAVINMIAVVLIQILERTPTIGLLKAIGLSDWGTLKVFIWNGLILIITGLIAGNALGLGLIASQDWKPWLKVNQENYFVTEVPVEWPVVPFILINVCTFLICGLFMLLPTLRVLLIRPGRAVRFQ